MIMDRILWETSGERLSLHYWQLANVVVFYGCEEMSWPIKKEILSLMSRATERVTRIPLHQGLYAIQKIP